MNVYNNLALSQKMFWLPAYNFAYINSCVLLTKSVLYWIKCASYSLKLNPITQK